MSSNGRITRSKGPADGVSLPPITRPKKGTNTEAETKKSMATQHQADGQGDQLGNTVEQTSPFARPGSRAGASTVPANTTEVPPASNNPFAQPGSRARSAQRDSASTQPEPQAVRFPNAPGSPVSSFRGSMFPQDINTSGSWDLIDPRCDAEVADITGEQNQQPVNQAMNTSYDSTQANPDQRLPQVKQVSIDQHLGTLYNQDFFVADTTGRRLSQIPDKSSYPYLLPNGHSALQLRLPDLLIYLKMDTYLIDVHTGHHYAVYSNCIEKMSIFPKLYSAWEYKQLLQTIQNDAMRFGVNSPQPTTSKASNSEKSTSGQGKSPSMAPHTLWPPSPCRPTIVKYEPPSFSLELPTQMLTQAECQQVLQNHVAAANAAFNKVAVFESLIQQEPHNALYYKEVQCVQKNQHIHVVIKLQHILEADDQFRCSAGLPRLDLPEHLWGIRDMWSAHSREQDFMAITAEIEILCQRLKLKGMYSVPLSQPSTARVQPNHNVHFQPINPAPKCLAQSSNQGTFNPLLNLVDDSPRPPSSSSSSSIPCGQPTPQGSTQSSNSSVHTPVPHASHTMVPSTPYVNQAAIDQHTGNPALLLPRVTPVTMAQHKQYQVPSNTQTSTLAPPATNVLQVQAGCHPQAIPEVQSPTATIPQDTLPTHLPFVPAPSAPYSALPTLSPGAPLQMDAQSKSRNGQGVKQASAGKQASNKVEPICWRCKQTGHLKRDCPMPPYCSKCRQEAIVWLNAPKRTKGLVYHNHQQNNHKLQWTHGSLTQITSVSTVVAITDQLFAPHGLNISQPQVLQVMYPVQVSLTVICLLNRVPRTVRQQHVAQHRPS